MSTSTWKDLIGKFQRGQIEIKSEKNSGVELQGYQLLVHGIPATRENYLYLVADSDLDQMTFKEEASVIILPTAEESADPLPDIAAANVGLVRERESVRTIIGQINEFFAARYEIAQALNKMQNAVKENQGIRALVDIVSELFGLPVDILDNAFHFVATSGDILIHSDFRHQYAHVGGSLPTDYLEGLKDSGLFKNLIDSHKPVFLHTDEFSCWFVPLEIDRIKVGYMVIFDSPDKEKSSLKAEYVQFLEHIAAFMCFELGKEKYYGPNKASHYNYILLSILKGSETDREEVRKKLALYDAELREELYLIQIERDDPALTDWSDRGMLSFLHVMFSNSIYSVIDNKLFFLLSRNKGHKITDREIANWNDYLASNNLWAGLTGPFYDLKHMEERLDEIRMVINYARRKQEKHILNFKDHKIDALAERLSEEGVLQKFCYEPVLKLVEYDNQNKEKGELVQTLKEYLSHPREITEICENLCIHKNTLYKRLDKIRGIMDCDFSSAEDIMKIQFTFHLLDVQADE